MAQEQGNPIYWDQHATKWNITLIFSLVVIVLGIIMGLELLLMALGAVMAGYSWLTTPRQFLLYRDSMVIVYGMPRTRHISFANISHVELLALPLGERLRIRLISGSRVMLMMRDPGAFRAHLDDALAQYHGEQSGAAFVMGNVLDRGGEPEFGTVDPDYYAIDDPVSEVASDVDFDTDVEPQTGTGSAGSYTDSSEPSEPVESEAEAEVYTGRVEQTPSRSGSYTETAEPDFSGEGRPAYGADVETETSTEDEPVERPESPY